MEFFQHFAILWLQFRLPNSYNPMMKFKLTIMMFAGLLLSTVASAASDYEAPALKPAGSIETWLIIVLFLVGLV